MTNPGFPFGQTITVIHKVPVGVDEFGNDVYDGPPETVTGCAISPAIPAEDYQATSQITADYTIHMPQGIIVNGPYDLIILPDGKVLNVVGIPREWVSPFTGNYKVQEVLARWVSTGGSAP